MAAVSLKKKLVEKEQPIKSLFDRVYLNRAVDAAAEEPDFPLALDADRTELTDTKVPWDDLRSILQAALMLDADPTLTPDEIKAILTNTASRMPGFDDFEVGEHAT